ncbi:MAG: MFS transporter [Firmicutes bacterium]|nr:MFS transporter [Bacillota bacterium]
MRRTVRLLLPGYFVGYGLMSLFGAAGVLMTAFFLVGIAKGNALNTCTVLVGNHTKNRARSVTAMHCFYAAGALLCPFFFSALQGISPILPVLGVSAAGLFLWLLRLAAGLPMGSGGKQTGTGKTDLSFLKTSSFWILTALVFCQNAAEQSVNGWLVTYFRNEGILAGALSADTITIMWGAALAGRLLVAFVFRIRNLFRALTVMGACCTALYLFLVQARTPVAAIAALFAFSFAMSGGNPLAVAGVGEQMSTVSMGILLPISGIGAIVMPLIIGILADSIGLRAGMAANLIPCIGMFVLSLVMALRTAGKEEAAAES